MSKEEFFSGEEGYYYVPITNVVWLVKNKTKENLINIRTMEISEVFKYDVSVDDGDFNNQVAITKAFEEAIFLSDWRDDENLK